MRVLACLLAALAGATFLLKDELLRRAIVHVLQHRVAYGALRSSPVSLGAASFSNGSLELRGLRVDNVPGNWTAPYAMEVTMTRYPALPRTR